MEYILFLGLIVGVIIFASNFSSKLNKLEKQNLNLNERLKQLEASETIVPPVSQEAEVYRPVPKAAALAALSPAKTAPDPEPVKTRPMSAKSQAAHSTPTPQTPEPKAPKPRKQSLEDRIGGQWSVWVGGLALLLGAVLLIRYSIEAGFFGPGARLIMAYVLGAALLAAGEWLRRADAKLPSRLAEATKSIDAFIPIPALLSAIGVFTWLGATYAAHELYGFIPSPAAFAGLGVISVGALWLSLRQGPLLAIIGLLASFATPLLIESEVPSLVGLYGYLLIIGVAALVLAWKTKWHWLSVGVTCGWLGWSVLSRLENLSLSNQMIWLGFLGIGFAVTVWLASRQPVLKHMPKDWREIRHAPVTAMIWSAIAALASVQFLTDFNGLKAVGEIQYYVPTLLDYVQIMGVLAALCLAGLRFRLQAGHIIIAAVLALTVLMETSTIGSRFVVAALSGVTVLLLIRQSVLATDAPSKYDFPQSLIWGVIAGGVGLSGAVLSAFSYPSPLSNDQHAVWLAAYAVLFAVTTAWCHRRETMPVTWVYALVTAAAYALAAIFAFDGVLLSFVLSIGLALAGAVAFLFRINGTRMAALGLAGLVVAHAVFMPLTGLDAISTRPILNELWVFLALPMALLAALGFGLRKQNRNDVLTDAVEAAALATLALFVVFQIRHLSNGGEIYADTFGFGELGLQVATGLCFTLAALSKRFGDNKLLGGLAQAVSLATLALFGIGGLFLFSPLFNGSEKVIGNIIFNSLTIGFAVPAILLGLCAWLARGRRPQIYVNLLGGLSLAGVLSWLTGTIRTGFNGEPISVFNQDFGNVELYVISAVWLIFGIILLAAGVKWRQMALRLASAIVIVLTVLKTFLIDMAGLDGVLRPLSFVGLGLVLIVIGRAYQKYWLSNRADNQPAEIGSIGEEE